MQISCITSADNLSGFVLRSDCTFDAATGDAGRHFEDLWAAGDFDVPEGLGLSHRYDIKAFIRAALWCLRRERASSDSSRRQQIDDLITAALSIHSPAPSKSKPAGSPPNGVLVKRPYTAAAHFLTLDLLLPKDALIHLITDTDHTLVSAALLGMSERIKHHSADLAFVGFEKELSQPIKEQLVADYKEDIKEFAGSLSHWPSNAAALRQAYIAAKAARHNRGVPGVPADVWNIPVQTFYEPNKTVGIVWQRASLSGRSKSDRLVELLDRSRRLIPLSPPARHLV